MEVCGQEWVGGGKGLERDARMNAGEENYTREGGGRRVEVQSSVHMKDKRVPLLIGFIVTHVNVQKLLQRPEWSVAGMKALKCTVKVNGKFLFFFFTT